MAPDGFGLSQLRPSIIEEHLLLANGERLSIKNDIDCVSILFNLLMTLIFIRLDLFTKYIRNVR